MNISRSDDIAIGAGISGLTAAALVAKSGLKVNLLEQPIEVIKHEMLYCLKYDGTPIHFHSDMDSYFKELEQLFNEDMINE